ncbi:DUF6338 family protein [Rhodococcus aetherivorans]
MLATFHALAVFITSVLPGAVFTFAFERESHRDTTVEFSERLVLFAAVSFLFAVLSAPLLYQLYRLFVATGDVQNGEPLPGWVWAIGPPYVVVPWMLGWWLGSAARRRHWVARPFTGYQPDPRGWDALFRTPELGGYVKLRMKEATNDNYWLLGKWAKQDASDSHLPDSVAAGFPYEQDLYLLDTCEITPEGLPVTEDDGTYLSRNTALLVRWSEVAYAEFIEG